MNKYEQYLYALPQVKKVDRNRLTLAEAIELFPEHEEWLRNTSWFASRPDTAYGHVDDDGVINTAPR